MTEPQGHDDDVLGRAFDTALSQDEPFDMFYPVGLLAEDAGPNGELVRFTSPEQGRVLSAPLDDVMRLLSRPLPVPVVQQMFDEYGVPDTVLNDLLNERWLVRVPSSSMTDVAALAGLYLLPNVSSMTQSNEPGELVVTSATTSATVSVRALVVAVLEYGTRCDVPTAVSELSKDKGIDASLLSEVVMETLADLIIAGVAYLSETGA